MKIPVVVVVVVVGLSLLLGAAAASQSTVSAASTANNNNEKWTPVRVTYDDLVRAASSGGDDGDADVVWDALRTTGMVSIANVPDLNKKTVLKDFEQCVVGASSGNNDDDEIMTHTFDDGTVRRTIATSSVDAGGQEEEEEEASEVTITNNIEHCQDFQDSSTVFRSAVQKVTAAVAKVIGRHSSSIVGGDGDSGSPLLLQDSIDESKTYDVESIIVEGEHLEHFHAYSSANGSSGGDEYEKTAEDKNEDEEDEQDPTTTTTNTIDWHTDQGIFLLFTPGQYNKGCHHDNTDGATATDGLFVQLGDNQPPREVEFDAQVDDLVLMLGDGVYQYINPYLLEDDGGQLTSVSHALKLGGGHKHSHESSNTQKQRVWYGRMVLPPPTAIHPRSPSKQTVAEVRLGMIHNDPDALQLGCSSAVSKSSSSLDSDHHQVVAVARELTDNTTICNEETSAFCWHRCMNYTDYDGVNDAVCEERSLSLGCVNPDGYLWTGKHDMTFGLGCVNLSIAGTYLSSSSFVVNFLRMVCLS